MTNINLDAALADVLDHEYEPTAGAPVAPTAPAEPYIAALPVSALFTDHTYQRPLDPFRVNKMADAFNLALVGIIEVSARPNGRYAVLDGQHRAALVRTVAFGSTNEDPHVACRVHTDLDVVAEAKLYHQLNTTRKQLNGWDRWVARRGAGDQAVLDIEASCARNGLIVGMQAGGNVLRSTKACEVIVEQGGIPLLDEVLSVTRMAWPDDQSGLDGTILQGLGHVLSAYRRDELDLTRLVETLSGVVPRQLVARAAAVREIHKGQLHRLAAHVIVERYNTVKGGRLVPFFDRVKPVSKTVTAKSKLQAEQRTQILAWANETAWDSRSNHRRASKAMCEAYAAAHGTEVAP